MNRRAGLTLTETLVALFIAALGMISLLTLFPLGALQMGQALKDGRCAQSAQEADNLLRWYASKYQIGSAPNHPITLALERAEYPSTAPANQTPSSPAWLSPLERNPSYPVFIDPQGFSSLTTWPSATMNTSVVNQLYLPRRTIYQSGQGTANYFPLITAQRDILRYTMLQDDMTYDPNNRSGAPRAQTSTSDVNVERGGRYNWLWVLQRPENARRSIVGLTIVVFDQRSPFFANGETERSFNPVTVAPGATSVTLNYTGTRPAITKGRWIVDISPGYNTQNLTTAQPGTTNFYGLRHANFYRVASVNDEAAGQLSIELETPLRRNDNTTGQYPATFMVLTGAAEVFERPPLTLE